MRLPNTPPRNIPDPSDERSPGGSRGSRWGAERVLLVCLLGIGLLGLVMTYGGRIAAYQNKAAAKATPTGTEATGKLQRDRMILHLNQRSRERAQQPELEVSQL